MFPDGVSTFTSDFFGGTAGFLLLRGIDVFFGDDLFFIGVITLTFGFPFGEQGFLVGDLSVGVDGNAALPRSTPRGGFGVVLGTLGDSDGDDDNNDAFGVVGVVFLSTGSIPGLGFCVLEDRSDLKGNGIDIDLGFGERDGVFKTRGDGDSDGAGDVGCVDGVDGTSSSAGTPGFCRGLGDRYDFDFDGDTGDDGVSLCFCSSS